MTLAIPLGSQGRDAGFDLGLPLSEAGLGFVLRRTGRKLEVRLALVPIEPLVVLA